MGATPAESEHSGGSARTAPPGRPEHEYARRLAAREAAAARCGRIHERIANARLLTAAVALAAAWLAFYAHVVSGWWLAVPVVAFAGLVAYHARVRRAHARALRAAAVYADGLARIEDRWAGSGAPGARFEDDHHVYAADLDLFCRGGLFELLSRARTRMGEDTLAGWLLAPAAVAAVRDRQAAVTELRCALDLREDLAVLGEAPVVGVHPEPLRAWAEAPNRLTSAWLAWLPAVLVAAAAGGAVVWGELGFATPLLAVLVVEAAIGYRLRKPLADTLNAAEHAFADLELLAGVLARLEREHFEAPALVGLMRTLRSQETAASTAIARLRRRVQFVEARRNPLVRVIDVPLMYSVQLARAVESWRRLHGGAIRAWLEATGEIEALLSLATFAYEHPEDPFPELAERRPALEAEGLGHPLLPRATCVRNDVAIGVDASVLLVSGSNMSGKSTLLRAVGLNTVLAMAGATVRAHRLRLAPLQVGASIRVNDSLQEGSSRFYAEISRLRRILELAGREPALLFLLDELLQGTNSRDRRIGAEGILRGLVERGAIGLVSTHDLALTDIATPAGLGLRNVHFQDDLADGRMRFDFKLREGVVTKSNGLELMRSIGLDVLTARRPACRGRPSRLEPPTKKKPDLRRATLGGASDEPKHRLCVTNIYLRGERVRDARHGYDIRRIRVRESFASGPAAAEAEMRGVGGPRRAGRTAALCCVSHTDNFLAQGRPAAAVGTTATGDAGEECTDGSCVGLRRPAGGGSGPPQRGRLVRPEPHRGSPGHRQGGQVGEPAHQVHPRGPGRRR